jgi:tripartite-type tricarboxylate transporter receptor subunit TctC
MSVDLKLDRRAVLGGMAASLAAPGIALAAWPERPVTIVHGFAAGGNADVVSRIMADALTRKLGQQFLVEAKPGAGGTLAANYTARARPDGSVIAVLPGGHSVSAAIYKQLPYRTVEDFTWITLLTDYPFVLATYPDHPVKRLDQLVDYARKAADPMLCANVGNGSGQHLAGELLSALAKIPLKEVPYKGGAEGMLDVIAKRVDLIIDTPTILLEQIRAGQLRPLGVTGTTPFFALPDTPSIAAIAPGYDTGSWLGMAAPLGLPAEIEATLRKTLTEILAEPEIIAKLRTLGNLVAPSTGAAFRTKVADEVVKWTKVVADAKIERL